MKLFECPLSAITHNTWSIISLVNETTDTDGNILHLPFEGALTDQPQWYRDAVKIVKSERVAHRQWLINNPPVKKGA